MIISEAPEVSRNIYNNSLINTPLEELLVRGMLLRFCLSTCKQNLYPLMFSLQHFKIYLSKPWSKVQWKTHIQICTPCQCPLCRVLVLIKDEEIRMLLQKGFHPIVMCSVGYSPKAVLRILKQPESRDGVKSHYYNREYLAVLPGL